MLRTSYIHKKFHKNQFFLRHCLFLLKHKFVLNKFNFFTLFLNLARKLCETLDGCRF